MVFRKPAPGSRRSRPAAGHGQISRIVDDGRINTGLAQIPVTGPGEITDDGGAVCDDLPVFRDLGRESLASHHDSLAVFFMIREIAGCHVVVTQDIHRGFQAIDDLAHTLMKDDLAQFFRPPWPFPR